MMKVLLITVGIASAAALIAISIISSGYNSQISYNNSRSIINDINSHKFIPINENANVKGYISSLLKSYLSWDELVKDSTTIIVGKVIKVRGSLVEKSEVVYGEGKRIEYGIPHTFSDIKVERVLKSTNNITEGDTIILQQLGGMLDEENMVVTDVDILVKEGERYVMFLGEQLPNDWHGLVTYGGITIYTRYIIIDDRVYSMNYIYPDKGTGNNLQVNGKPLDEFIKEITTIIRGR
ncbi:hypothetical protein HRbin04_00009 [archaeon HR04]|nr:hypothetical protein HRbin04_00009 [archaeon HR04]